MSRLLGAASLGVATMAAVAASIATEFGSARHAPAAHVEAAQNGRVIVKYKERSTIQSASGNTVSNAGPQAASVLGKRLGLTLTDGRILGTRTQVLKSTSLSSAELVAAVAADSEVESVEVDERAYVQTTNAVPPDDPLYAGSQTTTTPVVGQWYLRAPDSTVKSSINIEPAWAITTGSSSIVMADVDTGITTHPDLDSKILTGYDFISDVATANDGNARDTDPSDPGDWITASENASGSFQGCGESDSSWHGTETAGILGAATNNATGMAGVGYNIKVVPARALGKCGGYTSDIIAAAEWAGGILGPTSSYAVVDSTLPVNANPARVINLSLGGDGACSTSYRDALTLLRNHGVFAVAAAGNGDSTETGIAVSAPADCQPATTDTDQTPIVIAVAALRHTGTKVGFSNLGPQITIAAPGGNCVNTSSADACLYPILTTSNTGTTTPGSATYTTSYGNYSLGTSFSTPMVSGTIALMLSAAPTLSNAQVINLLKSTATAFPTTGGTTGITTCVNPATTTHQGECICTTATCGAGMLNAGAAVTAAAALAGPVATITDSATTVAAGGTVTLSAASSTASTGATISSYTWAITSGSSLATLSATSGSSVTLNAVASGTVTVQLTVTDSAGATTTSTTSVAVTAASTGSSGSTDSSSGSSGGGAANPAWLLALALAGVLLAPRKRRAIR